MRLFECAIINSELCMLIKIILKRCIITKIRIINASKKNQLFVNFSNTPYSPLTTVIS